MTNILQLSLIFIMLFATSVLSAQGSQTAQQAHMQTISEYLLYLPKDYKETGYKRWPLVLFLHGAGERGNDLEAVKKNGLPKLVEEGQDFPFIIASPQCPSGRWWSTDDLNLLLNDLIERYEVDIDRIYATGLSMGGFGTWEMAIRFPDRFAAIAPICGGGDPKQTYRLKDIPTWAFHGAKDVVVFPYQTERMVEALRSYEGNVQYTLYPEADHDSWTATYENQALYDWLLQQKKKNGWEKEFAAFDEEDSIAGKRENVILFTGSSSVRMWNSIKKDLGDSNILNRGFGGSTYADLDRDIERIVFRYNPSKVFIYSGDNDLNGNKSPEEVFTEFRGVYGKIKRRLPNTAIFIISAKPSISREHLIPKYQKFNQYVEGFLEHEKNAAFIDVFTPMMDKDGKPKKELFLKDNLHLNKAGYALWTKIIKPYLEN